MEIEPVSKLEAPAYPSAKVAGANALLSTNVPRRWRSKRLAGALAVTLAANFSGGCGSTVSESAPPRPVPAVCDPFSDAEVDHNRLIAQAGKWCRSIYGKPQTQFRMGGAIIVRQPQVNEGDAGGEPPSDSPPPDLPRASEEGPGVGSVNP
jgi:hypothetical protein